MFYLPKLAHVFEYYRHFYEQIIRHNDITSKASVQLFISFFLKFNCIKMWHMSSVILRTVLSTFHQENIVAELLHVNIFKEVIFKKKVNEWMNK